MDFVRVSSLTQATVSVIKKTPKGLQDWNIWMGLFSGLECFKYSSHLYQNTCRIWLLAAFHTIDVLIYILCQPTVLWIFVISQCPNIQLENADQYLDDCLPYYLYCLLYQAYLYTFGLIESQMSMIFPNWNQIWWINQLDRNQGPVWQSDHSAKIIVTPIL